MGKETSSNVDKSPDRIHQEILNDERLGWARELMDLKGTTERAKLREELDSQVKIKATAFGLGDSVVEAALSDEVNGANPEVVVGSVDATRFETKWHETAWYKPFAESVAKIDNLKTLFDGPTLGWYNSLSPAFEVFRNLGKMNESDFDKNVKKDIWKLVSTKGGEDMIYGANGFFNFILAYQRIENLFSPLELSDMEGFNLKDISVKKIKLVSGKGVGKKGGANDRFAYAAIRKAV